MGLAGVVVPLCVRIQESCQPSVVMVGSAVGPINTQQLLAEWLMNIDHRTSKYRMEDIDVLTTQASKHVK